HEECILIISYIRIIIGNIEISIIIVYITPIYCSYTPAIFYDKRSVSGWSCGEIILTKGVVPAYNGHFMVSWRLSIIVITICVLVIIITIGIIWVKIQVSSYSPIIYNCLFYVQIVRRTISGRKKSYVLYMFMYGQAKLCGRKARCIIIRIIAGVHRSCPTCQI